jgi:phosphotransferase family enzyme
VKAPPARFPDLELLSRGLNTVIGGNGSKRGRVTIVHRSPVVYASTYPSEIVTCRIGARVELKLYCKYMGGVPCDSYGHRGGVPYETEVYRRILQPLGFSVPKFYGSYDDMGTGDTWLILGCVDPSLRLAKGPQPETMLRAAEWIGRFHAANEPRASMAALSFLNRYDFNYYLGWVRRTSLFARGLHQNFPWLTNLSERFEECIDVLLSAPLTVIHGEYYPHNVLVSDGVIYPLDWESAAIAAGEIDLATLTEAWGPEIIRQCELKYQRTRWPEGSPGKFARRLAAARLYLCFRWLGDQPDWTLSEDNRSYFDQMRSAGEELGFI